MNNTIQMKQLSIILLTLLALSSFVFQGCDQSGCTDPMSISYDPDATEADDDACVYPNLMLHFHPKMGTEDFAYGTDYDINGVKARFSTAQFYVSGIQLMDDSGNSTSFPDKYLLVKPTQMMYEIGEFQMNHAHMLMFNLGIDSTTNLHVDPSTHASDHPLAIQSPSMYWSWNSGYIFLRFDGEYDSDGDDVVDTPFEVHLGTNNFLTPVSIMLHENVTTENYMANLDVNFAAFFDGVDLRSDNTTHTMDNMPLAMQVIGNTTDVFNKQ